MPGSPGARARGKVAVFIFNGDDVYQPVRAEVVRVLRRRGLNVTATLRPATRISSGSSTATESIRGFNAALPFHRETSLVVAAGLGGDSSFF